QRLTIRTDDVENEAHHALGRLGAWKQSSEDGMRESARLDNALGEQGIALSTVTAPGKLAAEAVVQRRHLIVRAGRERQGAEHVGPRIRIRWHHMAQRVAAVEQPWAKREHGFDVLFTRGNTVI